MKKYLFSIFVRGALAFSGFLVFLVSAKLFGAEGRGVISYGISIYASLGLFFSFSLGRTFVAKTNQNDALRKETISSFLGLQFLSILLTISSGLLFWYYSSAAQSILTGTQAFFLALTSPYYIWSFNGVFFYAAFVKTFEQDRIMLIFRCFLIAFLAVFYIQDSHNLTLFISIYSLILAIGAIVELVFLFKISGAKRLSFRFDQIKDLLKKSLWPHADFLSFNIFPLILIVLSGWYVEKDEIGRASFAIQIINLIFLLATTANLRISAYVSDVGFRSRLKQFKKLFIGTILLSFFSVIIIYFGLGYVTQTRYFLSFQGVSKLFLISALSIPGYMMYQFFNPIWLEIGKVKESALLNIANLVVVLSLTPFFLSYKDDMGMMILFSLFHVGLLLTQLILYKKYVHNET